VRWRRSPSAGEYAAIDHTARFGSTEGIPKNHLVWDANHTLLCNHADSGRAADIRSPYPHPQSIPGDSYRRGAERPESNELVQTGTSADDRIVRRLHELTFTTKLEERF